RSDSLRAGEQVGDLVHLALVEVVQVHVVHAGAIRQERQRAAVGCPLWVHVAADIHSRQQLDSPAGQVVGRNAEVAEGESIEVGARSAVGGPGKGASVG